MKRRKYLLGLGSTVGLGTIIGSGAFSSVSANRDVTVAVEEDYQAYLRLTQRGSGGRSYADGPASTVGFNIPGGDDDEYGGTDPDGVGRDSVYRFSEDAAGDESGLFGIENQGTATVRVYGSQADAADVPTVKIFNVESGDLLTQASQSEPLDSGESILCGLEIDTHGVDVREDVYDISLFINADEIEQSI